MSPTYSLLLIFGQNSETTASFFSYGIKNTSYSNLQLLGIMIFDTRTGRFARIRATYPLTLHRRKRGTIRALHRAIYRLGIIGCLGWSGSVATMKSKGKWVR